MADLGRYRRTTTPDLEARPQEPVLAVLMISGKGIEFTLVREAVWSPDQGWACCWFVWREQGCVGMITTNLLSDVSEPFVGVALPDRKAMNPRRAFKIWRSVITDGADARFVPTPSRGLGIMTSAYAEVVRQVSQSGWALASNPKARSRQAKELWTRLRTLPGIEVVRSRSPDTPYEFAFMLASSSTPAPVRATLKPAEPLASD